LKGTKRRYIELSLNFRLLSLTKIVSAKIAEGWF
jgi:hypothetical protein